MIEAIKIHPNTKRNVTGMEFSSKPWRICYRQGRGPKGANSCYIKLSASAHALRTWNPGRRKERAKKPWARNLSDTSWETGDKISPENWIIQEHTDNAECCNQFKVHVLLDLRIHNKNQSKSQGWLSHLTLFHSPPPALAPPPAGPEFFQMVSGVYPGGTRGHHGLQKGWANASDLREIFQVQRLN